MDSEWGTSFGSGVPDGMDGLLPSALLADLLLDTDAGAYGGVPAHPLPVDRLRPPAHQHHPLANAPFHGAAHPRPSSKFAPFFHGAGSKQGSGRAMMRDERPQTAPTQGQAAKEEGGGVTSRTLFVRNISSNTEDAELMELFGSYGDVRDMYTACKYRGFFMISFFDERAALAAMDCLQGKSLRRRKMDIHLSIPKENQVDMATLLVSNVDAKIGLPDVINLFRAFGEIKTIKGNRYRSNVRTVEYYDERHAAGALKALHNADVWSRRIKIQYGRFGSSSTSRVRTNGHASRQENGGANPGGGGGGFRGEDAQGQPSHAKGYRVRRKSVPGSSLGSSALRGEATQAASEGCPLSHHNTRGGCFSHSHHSCSSSGGGGGKARHQQRGSHFALNLEHIFLGRDLRTTVMIRNIPNKYTQRMLLAEVDCHLKGRYDFFYLPIDFKNKCNVGYAFINVTDAVEILTLHRQFNGKKWSHFNSGKICEITYARIQGKTALAAHFRNSSLMTVDESCQPKLFNAKQEVEPIFATKPAKRPEREREGEKHVSRGPKSLHARPRAGTGAGVAAGVGSGAASGVLAVPQDSDSGVSSDSSGSSDEREGDKALGPLATLSDPELLGAGAGIPQPNHFAIEAV